MMTAAPLARTPQPQSAADQGVGKATPAVSVIIATSIPAAADLRPGRSRPRPTGH
jgi:hypothetical protein